MTNDFGTKNNRIDPKLFQEILSHANLCEKYASRFIEREEFLEKVYLMF